MRERDVLIQFLLSRREADRFNSFVRRSGMTRSAYLRQLIAGLVPADKPPPDYFQMMRELHAIGNNLNQIARHAHVTGVVDEAVYDKNIVSLDKAIKRITDAVILPKRCR
jgi:hypothetical protein